MRLTRFVAAFSAIALLAGVAGTRHDTAVSAATPTPSQPSSTDDQVDLAMTVYNSNMALIRDVREFACWPAASATALHGHRGHGQSGDRAFPIADRSFAR